MTRGSSFEADDEFTLVNICTKTADAERAQVADALYDPDQSETEAAWATVSRQRAEDLERGTVLGMTREEADEYLDARQSAG